jgi:hypothetical protein
LLFLGMHASEGAADMDELFKPFLIMRFRECGVDREEESEGEDRKVFIPIHTFQDFVDEGRRTLYTRIAFFNPKIFDNVRLRKEREERHDPSSHLILVIL